MDKAINRLSSIEVTSTMRKRYQKPHRKENWENQHHQTQRARRQRRKEQHSTTINEQILGTHFSRQPRKIQLTNGEMAHMSQVKIILLSTPKLYDTRVRLSLSLLHSINVSVRDQSEPQSIFSLFVFNHIHYGPPFIPNACVGMFALILFFIFALSFVVHTQTHQSFERLRLRWICICITYCLLTFSIF